MDINRKVEFSCIKCGKKAHKHISAYRRTERHFCSPECYQLWRRTEGPATAKDDLLSSAELKIVTLVELPDKLIADQLNLSTNTVKVHWKNIRTKTGLPSKISLAIWACKKGLI